MPVLSDPKHELYAQHRAKGKTQVEAYELAGYTISESNHGYNASRLESENERVKDRIAELLEKSAELSLIDNKWVLEKFKAVAERCMQTTQVLGEDGKLVGDYKFDASAVNKALDSIAKHTGFYEQDNKQRASLLNDDDREILKRFNINVSKDD